MRRRLVRGAVILSAVLVPAGLCLHFYALGRAILHEHLPLMHFLSIFGAGCVAFGCLVYAIAWLYTLHRASRRSAHFWGDWRTFWLCFGGPVALLWNSLPDDDLGEESPKDLRRHR